MERAVIGMGTNLGDLEENLLLAAGWLEDAAGLRLEGLSPVYSTRPLGPAVHPFLNAAALVTTDLGPASLLEMLKECERRAGRPDDHEKWGPRVLDLDILVMGDLVRDSDPPLLPHPGLLERDFALRPLLDLVADAVHPVTGQPLSQALETLGSRTIQNGPHPLPASLDYVLLEHTADAGLEIEAADLERLLALAAMALADAVVPRERLRESERVDVEVAGQDNETALVGLMQEVIFLLETRGFLPSRARVRLRDDGRCVSVRASLYGSKVDPSWARLPVKAATHHDLAVEQVGGAWKARVYLDV